MDIADMMRTNEANWDTRTPVHANSRFYAQDSAYWFSEYEWADLGELAGRSVLHLQCHIGTETVEFARRGAVVTGLDISAESLAQAQKVAAEAEVEIDYVHANVYDASFASGSFDIVYTGKGSMCYLPDLPRWAALIARLLKPGGQLYLAEFHPLLNALGPVGKPGQQDLELRYDYVAGRGAIRKESTHSYTDGPALDGTTVSYEWPHGIGEVVTAVAGAGLRVTTLRESTELQWPRFPDMIQTDRGWWRLPDSSPRIPLLYALQATKP